MNQSHEGVSPTTPEVSELLRLKGIDLEAITRQPNRDSIEELGESTWYDGWWKDYAKPKRA